MNTIRYTTCKGTRQFKPAPMSVAEFSRRSAAREGLCLACGKPAHSIAPGARKQRCVNCRAPKAYGLEELLRAGMVTYSEPAPPPLPAPVYSAAPVYQPLPAYGPPNAPAPPMRVLGCSSMGCLTITILCLAFFPLMCHFGSRKNSDGWADSSSSGSSTSHSTRSHRRFISSSELGAAWPLTVDSGEIEAEGNLLLFHADGQTYGLNGLASAKYGSIDPIWKRAPNSRIAKMNIGPLLNAAAQLR